MPTGEVHLSPLAGNPPDGSASNVAAALSRRQGTEAGSKKHFYTIDFDGAGAVENWWWTFTMPADYASGGSLDIYWMANATSGNCRWQAKVGAITPGDADTPIEKALAAAAGVTTAANATEARRLTKSTITLTMDSAAAGDIVFINLFRDSADAADTMTVDGEVLYCMFQYTTT